MKQTILSNISFNLFIKVITYLFSFLTLLYISRVLQPTAFGKISFVSSFAGYFVMLASLGMPIYAMRACAERRNNRKELSIVFNELWSINVVLSFISIAIFVITIFLIPKLNENVFLLSIYGSAVLFQMIGCEWLFRALEKFKFLAVSSLICKLISLFCIFLFVRSEQQIFLYAMLSVLIAHGSSIVSFLLLRRYVDISFRIKINKQHFKPLFIFFLMSCAVYVYSSLDMTMLGFMKTEYEVGLYSIAAKGKRVLTMLGGLVWSSILPLATQLWKDGYKSRFESLAAKSLIIVSLIQTLVSIICIIFAKEIILVVGGEAYLGSVLSFRILLLSLMPIGASNILGGQVLIPTGYEKRLLFAEITGAIFNFIANLYFIPRFSIVGASITTVISEVIVLLICMFYCQKDLKMDFGFGLIKKIIVKIKEIIKRNRIRLVSKIKKESLPFYCPCCKTYLESFVNGGFEDRPEIYNINRYKDIDQEVICPICHALPRHRILVSWMNDNIEWLRDKKILHFAQEKSLKIWLDSHNIKYLTADLYNQADLKVDIESTGLEESSYDMIICNHVLEHVSDYNKALKELYRILRPDGKLILSFPVDLSLETLYEDKTILTKEERIEHFGQHDHQRVFGKDSPTLFEHIGFKVTEINGNNYDSKIKPVIGPANYDYNVLWCLIK